MSIEQGIKQRGLQLPAVKTRAATYVRGGRGPDRKGRRRRLD